MSNTSARSRPAIRLARPADAGSLAALAIQVWLHTYATDGVRDVLARYVLSQFTAERFARDLDDPAMRVLVAESNDHLLGFASLFLGRDCPTGEAADVEMEMLYVQEHFTGAGVGTALLRSSLEFVRALEGRRRLWLTVNARNERAIAFYAKHGFVRTGRDDFVLDGERHENHVLVAPAQ